MYADCRGRHRMARILELTLNGRRRVDAVPDNRLLLDYLRETVGLTGTKTGCDGGECGACTVLVDDTPTLSCLTLAATVAGKRVDTVESLGKGGTPPQKRPTNAPRRRDRVAVEVLREEADLERIGRVKHHVKRRDEEHGRSTDDAERHTERPFVGRTQRARHRQVAPACLGGVQWLGGHGDGNFRVG